MSTFFKIPFSAPHHRALSFSSSEEHSFPTAPLSLEHALSKQICCVTSIPAPPWNKTLFAGHLLTTETLAGLFPMHLNKHFATGVVQA